MSIQKCEMISGEKAKHTIFGSVCSDSFDAFRDNKWREANSLGFSLAASHSCTRASVCTKS